jgi:two-component system sensor histidine kinase PilS (NtrC family)
MPDVKLTLIIATVVLAAALGLVAGTMLYVTMRRRRSLPKGGGTSEVGFVVDTFHQLVAELKQKESELQELRARAEERAGDIESYNENILQSVPSGVISTDKAWKVVKANAAAGRILGLEPGEIRGADFTELFPDDRMRRPDKRGEAQYVTASGKRLWLGYSLSPLVDSGGAEIGRLFVFTDLTGLKALEEQAELRSRLSSLGEMSAGIAHELRNSMGVIAGYMRLLSRQADPSLKETVEAVDAEVGVMDRTITDFQGFTRSRELNLSEVRLRPLVEAASQGVLAQRPDIEVALDVPGELALEGDEVLLRQALANLIQNAADAMPEGGSVTVSAEASEGKVTLRVLDTGHGIDDEMREKIFLPFFTTKEKGTGLGLAIAHRTVIDHSGGMAVESREGGGTAFRVTLPVRQPREGE